MAATDFPRLKLAELVKHGSPRSGSGHGEESVSTALSSRSFPNNGTESVSTLLTSRTSRRASTVASMSRMDQRKRLVRAFLQANDFLHVNEGRHSWGSTCYPLHTAVHQKKPAVVKALLLLGARRDSKYRGNTPEEYAEKRQRRWGGYEEILKAFEDMRGAININKDALASEQRQPAESESSDGGEVQVEL